MTPWALAYGLAALAVLGVNIWAEGIRSAAVAISATLCGLWVLSCASLLLFGVPDGLRLYPLWDAAAAVVVATAFVTRPAIWKGVMLGTFVVLAGTHAALWAQDLTGAADFSFYMKALEWIVIVQMLVATWPGVRRVVHILNGLRVGSPARRDVGG